MQETTTHIRGPQHTVHPVRSFKAEMTHQIYFIFTNGYHLYLHLEQTLCIRNTCLRCHRRRQLKAVCRQHFCFEGELRWDITLSTTNIFIKKYQYHFLCFSPLVEEPSFHMFSFLCSLRNIF